MGWKDCGAYGSTYYETPNIDRLATQAMRFTDAYACPICSPTRASILTGQYSARHGITVPTGHLPPQPPGHDFRPANGVWNRLYMDPESKNYLEPSQVTYIEALRDAGWKTAHVGKWHLGITEPHWPEQQGFGFAVHGHPDPGPPSYFSPYGFKMQSFPDGPTGEYVVDRMTDEAIKFIEANRDQPFALNLWQYGVHGPWGHKLEYTEKFSTKKDPSGKQGNPIMGSMLKSVDDSVGRIMETLDRLKLADRTLLVFTSDNGGNIHSNLPTDPKFARRQSKDDTKLADWRKWAGEQPPTNNEPLRSGKGWIYEGGIRVPMMVRWPGKIAAGSTSGEVVGSVDLYPTILDYLGVPRPKEQTIDGISIRPALEQSGKVNREAYFTYIPHGAGKKEPAVCARAGDWKLIRFWTNTPEKPVRLELYNLKDDIGEAKDLAGEMPEKAKEMDRKIEEFLSDTQAIVPVINPEFGKKPEGDAKKGKKKNKE